MASKPDHASREVSASRRGFLKASAAAGSGLLLSFSMPGLLDASAQTGGGALNVFVTIAADGAVTLTHDEIPGFMAAMHPPLAMEFLVPDKRVLATLKPGMRLTAAARKRGADYILDPLPTTTKPRGPA